MEKLDITISLSHSADFDEHTWTFQPVEKSFKVRAGTYAIIHKPDLDEYVKDIAIEFAKHCQMRMDIIPQWKDEDLKARFDSQFIKEYKK